jgi:Mannosyltransferase (PIG-V)
VARAAVGLAYVVAVVAADELRPEGRPYHLEQGLFAWDGTFYRDITERGYDGVEEEALRFFPLVPLLARLVAIPLLGHERLALLVVANVAALVAGVLLHRLVVHETGDGRVASCAAWLVALLPPAMVLVLGYAESTMMALAVAVFLCLRRGRWWAAAGLGLAVGLCRPIGVVLAVPAAVEAARGLRATALGERLARAAAVLAPAAGLAVFLAWVEVNFGDWTLPVRLQGSDELRGSLANPVLRAAESLGGLFGDERFGDGLHAPFIVLYLALAVVTFRRWPASYGAYAAALLVVALSSEDIGSFERYGLSAFPLVVALAGLVAGRGLERMALTASAAGLAGFSTLAFLGTFVP